MIRNIQSHEYKRPRAPYKSLNKFIEIPVAYIRGVTRTFKVVALQLDTKSVILVLPLILSRDDLKYQR